MLDFANKPPRDRADVTLLPGIAAVIVLSSELERKAIGRVAGVTLLNSFSDPETGYLRLTADQLATARGIGSSLVGQVREKVGYDSAIDFENGIRGHLTMFEARAQLEGQIA